MYQTADGQKFVNLDTLARSITHRAPDTGWRAEHSPNPYWVTVYVTRIVPSQPGSVRIVSTVQVPRAALVSWLDANRPSVAVPRARW